MKKMTIGRTEETKDEWLTPPAIIRALGEFDLDPCMPENRPWDTAKLHYTKKKDGLQLPWNGRVWCNPPYGNQAGLWLQKCAAHGNCIALVFARTDTRWFFDHVWDKAKAVMFLKGRIRFHHVSGKAGSSATAASTLIAYDWENAEALAGSGIKGKVIWPNGKLIAA